jgi:hypothetical protein
MEPTPEPTPPSRRPLFALTAAALIAIAVGVAFMAWPRTPAAKKPTAFVEPTDGESAVQRALRLAAVDSTKKNAWVDEVPGQDLKPFSAKQRQVFIAFVNAERCTCGCGFTLGACRQYDSSCEVSLPRVRRLYDSVATGQLTEARGVRLGPGGR